MPRVIEFILALVGLIFLSPIFLIIGMVIKFSSKGSLFYCAKRVGENNTLFTIYKFRTMIHNANKVGPPITTQNDGRITLIGFFLRKTKLDELPQLLNVLKGDMTFVGPRPENPEIVKKYSRQQKEILNYKPGITSPASIFFRKEESLIASGKWQDKYTEILSKKIAMDLDYLHRATVFTDLKIIFKTVFQINKKIKPPSSQRNDAAYQVTEKENQNETSDQYSKI